MIFSTISTGLYKSAKLWMRLPTQIIGILTPNVILILLGINKPPEYIPVVDFIQQHRIAALVVGCMLAFITLLAAIISHGREPHDDANNKATTVTTTSDTGKKPSATNRHQQGWVIATFLSTTSFFLSSTLLVIVLIHPPWCPAAFCSSTRSFPPGSVSDANLVLYPLSVQNSSFFIPGDPLHYSQPRLPQDIGAERVSRQPLSSSFRVVLNVQSLVQSQDAILIKQVAMILVQVLPVPRPLNIWSSTPSTLYNTNPFLAVYRGEQVGALLTANSISTPPSLLHLLPNEAEQFNVQLISRVPVNLEFRVQITYVLGGDAKSYTLTLPQTFKIIISDSSNWKEYRLQQGHFVPVP